MKTLLIFSLLAFSGFATLPAAATSRTDLFPANGGEAVASSDSLIVRYGRAEDMLPNEALPTEPERDEESQPRLFPVDESWYLHYADNRAVVKRDSLYGYIDRAGREVIPCRYRKAYCFNDGMAMIRHNHEIFAIDTLGNRLDVRVDIPRFGGRTYTEFVGWVWRQIPFESRAEYDAMKQYAPNVLFTIDTDGCMVDIEKAGDYPDAFFEKIRKVLEYAPRWTPGTVDGKPVALRYLLPVDVAKIRITGWRIVNPTEEQEEKDVVFPLFDEGYVPITFYDWYKGRMRLPSHLYQKAKSGTVTVTFDIDAKGRLCNVIVNDYHDKSCRDKVLEVLKKSPRWTPATVDGKPVAVRISWTFRFKFR